LRVNHPPNLTIIDFLEPVLFNDAVASVQGGVLTVTVPKEKSGHWAELCTKGSRSELNERRKLADERKDVFMKEVCRGHADWKCERSSLKYCAEPN
jgi:hypothetical protein